MPCEPPCSHAICAVTVELPGPSHLLPCAVPTGVGSPKPDRDSRRGHREGWAGAACLCPSVPSPRLVLSRVCVSAVTQRALGWLSHFSGRWLVPQQRTWPSGQGFGISSPHRWSQGTCTSCLSCLRVYSVPSAAPCMPGLVCVTYWAMCSAREQSHSLDSVWGWELTKPQRAFLKNGVILRLGREELVLTILPTPLPCLEHVR